ncbi:MAG TPA: ABC transporter permease, partial [Thermomicrobiales bacterium]|nr:ABC transporter permease [Thermomicrobiales bacterium]
MTTPTTDIDRAATRREQVARRLFADYGSQVLLLLAVVALAATNRDFRQPANLQSVLLQASFAGVGACGMTLLVISGSFDLSVAGQLALAGIAAAKALPYVGVGGAVAAAMAVGVVLGIVNGVVVTKVQVPAFIATLGMMYVYIALGLLWTDSQVAVIADATYRRIGTGTVAGLPIPFLIMIVAYLAAFAVLRFLTFGRYLRAVGSNERAAQVAGLPVDRVRVFAFALVGLFTTLAGVILSATLSSANATMAIGYELTVIAVVVIGGTRLSGGAGTLAGSFTGALLFA